MTEPTSSDWPSSSFVAQSIANAAAASSTPRDLGDVGEAQLVPDGWHVEQIDRRQYELHPRERYGTFEFVDVVSFADYVNRYSTGDTLVYAVDVPDAANQLLTGGHIALVAVLDDYPIDSTSSRTHRAALRLRPTPAARRWGAVFDRWVTQEQLLDLVVEGAAEIAQPDAADLRDLASNLHAIRSADVESVIRTGGEGTIKVAQNVQLRAGASRDVTFPEQLRVVLIPFHRAQERFVGLAVRVKAKVTDKHVTFQLTAPTLGDQLIAVIEDVARMSAERTGLEPFWRTDNTV